MLSGCSLPPGLNIVGAYFPAWLFCIVFGVIISTVVYALLGKWARVKPAYPWLFYPSLVLFVTFLVWLVLFRY
ncbi:YtcA family lipoprotein [Shimwellia pseudoproteus]|uniref:YtcA family lipoprotein n=1 Tax=Shimwellia pseudoproteus TaxID=570012 RepID=UPI0038CD7072